MNLYKFTQLHPYGVGYDQMAKEDFKNAGQKFLKSLVKDPEVVNHRIGYNPGGIAVSGDHSVMLKYRDGSCVNLFFNLDFSGLGICYRKCNDFNDHTGKQNNFIPWEKATSPGEVQIILREFVYGREYTATL